MQSADVILFRSLLAPVVLALLFACSDGSDSNTLAGDNARMTGRVVIQPSPFRFEVIADDESLLQQSGPILITRPDGSIDELTEVISRREEGDTDVYEVRTPSRTSVSVTVTPTSNTGRSFKVSLSGEDTDAISIGLELEPGELIYGLTERLRDSAVLIPAINGPLQEDFAPDPESSLDRRGEIIEMFVRPTISLYAPFYHSSRGYGVWVEGTNPGVFDVGATHGDLLQLRMETARGQGLAFHIFLGPRHEHILESYFEQTGFPIRVPDWAFRHWLWRDELTSGPTGLLDGELVNAEIAQDMAMYERFGIPSGVYLFDRPYLVGAADPDSQGFHIFEWDSVRLPNIDATLESLRSRGFRLAIWSASWARDNGPGSNGAEAAVLGFLAPRNSRVIDFTNPDAAAWWRAKLGAFMSQYGISAIKLDRGEEYVPSFVTDIYSDGRSGREVHNAFPVLQAQVHHDAAKDATDDDFAIISRAGYSGTQQWAASWGGDTVGTELGLRSAIVNVQRAGFIGFPTWGSDTGGYYSFRNREVFARWLQFSALTPIMEIGGIGSRSPWDMPTEPAFDEELIAIYVRYVKLHHDLISYTAAQADLASSQGMPIARAMVFDFPDDDRFADSWDQYMYGPDLLVAPLWQIGARERQVLIPEGTWRWYWDVSQSWTGPATITVPAALETLPLFIRDGASVLE